MNTKHFEILRSVARSGNFAAAARENDLDPSVVSRAVAGLEDELGVRLFHRTTRALSLTEAGARYLERIDAVLEELDRAREEAIATSKTPSGVLRLTTSVAFGQTQIVPRLGAFRSTFPNLDIELLLSDENLNLLRNRVDLAIRLAPEISGDLVCAKFMRTQYRVCAGPDYIASAGQPRHPADLRHHTCLTFTLPAFRSRWLFRDRRGTITEVPVKGAIAISSALALREAARNGLGLALLANWMVDRDIAEGRLVDVFPDSDVTATSFETAAWFVYPNRAFLPAKVRATIDFLRRHVAPQSTT